MLVPSLPWAGRSGLTVVIVAAMEFSTSAGPATAVIEAQRPEHPQPAFLLVLTHGAGGGTETRDLLAASRAGREAGAVAVRVLQPYRVRGARAPGSADRQDAAWLEIIAALRDQYPGVPLIQGGRSNGARVACRTAQAAGAAGVIALAFPLHPPGRAGSPEHSRAGELRGAGVPVLVVNGASDPFGIPDQADASEVVVLARRDPRADEEAAGGSDRGRVLAAGSARPGGGSLTHALRRHLTADSARQLGEGLDPIWRTNRYKSARIFPVSRPMRLSVSDSKSRSRSGALPGPRRRGIGYDWA